MVTEVKAIRVGWMATVSFLTDLTLIAFGAPE